MITFVLENSYDTITYPTNDTYLIDYEQYSDEEGVATQRINKIYDCSLEKLENAIMLSIENNQIKDIEDKFGTLDFSGAGNSLGFDSYEIEPSMIEIVFEKLTKIIEQYL